MKPKTNGYIAAVASAIAAGLMSLSVFPAFAEEPDTAAPDYVTDAVSGDAAENAAAEDTTEAAADAAAEGTAEDTADAPPETVKPEYHLAGDQILFDENGNAYCMDGENRRTGKFTLSPDFAMGDINDDDTVNAADAAVILIASAYAGTSADNAEHYLHSEYAALFGDADQAKLFSDVNEDGVINAADAAAILIYSAENGAGAAPQPLGTHAYFADHNGILQKGFARDEASGKTYYADENYMLQYGFITDSDQLYYFGKDGALPEEGWLEINEKIYYCGSSGAMQTGWLRLEEGTYYLNEGGIRQTGTQSIDGSIYHFSQETGLMATGWLDIDEAPHYFNNEGIMQTGWQEIGGSRYWFSEDGVMGKDQMVDAIWLGSDGIAKSELYSVNKQRALDAFAKNGTSVDGIFSYVRATTRYKKTESTKTLAQIESNGWLYYVDYSMTHYYGVCYYLAAKMDFLLQEAGYECRMVHATHSSGDHYWNQININGTWTNYDPTNNWANKTWDQMVALGSYRLIGYVTPEYK